MSESIEHGLLVSKIAQYVMTIVREDLYDFIEIDNGKRGRPTPVEGYIPDVYFNWDNILIIGEAKTVNDFERKHSQAQFHAYMDACKWFSGHGTIIIAVPWALTITAKNYFKREKQKIGFSGKIIILAHLGMEIRVWEI